MIDTVKDPSPSSKNSDSIPVSVAARVIPDPANLVGRWHLNESTGTTAGDDSGSANSLTLNNMPASSWVSGQSGSALSFSGNNQDVSIASATHAIQTPSVTLLAWVKPDQNNLPWEWIAAQGDNYGLYIRPQTRSLVFYIKNAGSGWTDAESAPNSIFFDQWQHVAGSFDTATQTLTVYIDGNEAGSITISEDIGYTTGNGFTIGSMQSERFFDGSIDEVSIYETALAASDINSLKELDEVDITPPVITLNGSDEITLIQNTEYTDLGATATDNIDDVLIVDVDFSAVNTAVLGTYLVTYSATDTAGNIGLATRSVHVTGADTTAPVITLNGENPITLTVGNSYTDAGASATDDVDAEVNVSSSGTVDTSTVGIYTLIYTATDSSSNVALATRTINVEAASDFGNLIGQWHLNENTGAVASDDSGNTNDLTLNNMSNANWVSGQAGSALDFGGNSQDASRDNVSNALQTPSLTLLAWVKPDQNGLSWEWIAAQGDNYGLYINPQSRKLTFYIKNAGSGWTDVESADNAIVFDQWQHVAGSFDAATQTLKVYIDGNEVNTQTINEDIGYTTGNGFTIGSMQNQRFFEGSIDEVNVYDTALSESNINLIKEQDVVDITPPVITLNGSDELSIVLNTPYSDLGATATDNVDGLVPVDVDSSEVNTAVLGIYLVTYTAIDSSGNTSEITRTVNVTEADATAPVITLNGLNPVTVTLGSGYTDAGATATDNVDGVVNVTTSGEVDTSTEGIYIITYEATDSSDNTSFSTRTVHVEVASELGSLLGRWHFDEDTGTVANDDSGNNTNLDLNNMSNVNWITGQSGSALSFSGNSQDVSIGTASNALQTSSVTVLAWVNPNQNGLPWEWIAAQGDNYGLYLNPQSRSLLFYIKNAGSGWTSVESAANTIVFDQWQHVAGSFDAATQTLRLYVAGIEVGSVIVNQDIGYTTGNGFTIGSMQNARFFDGRIDEVSVYDKALSEANINVLKGQGEVDITPPFITINGSDEINVILNSDYSDLGATATDNVDGVLIVDVDVPVDTAVPDTYQVTYTATDTAGNTSKAIRTVNVLESDITAPVITLNGTDPVIVGVGESYTDAGATAIDDVDITVSVTIDTANVDTSTPGAYTVTFTAEDAAGNTDIATRTVNVVANAQIDESVFIGTYDGADQPPEGRRGSIEFLDYVDPVDPGATADWLAESTGLVLTVSNDADFTNALQAAEPGDRIQLESGVYQMQSIQISGSEGNPVTIESAPGQWAIFDGAVPGTSSLIDVRGAWLTFRSLEIRNGTAGSLFITQSHHHLYEGLKIHNNSRGFDFTDGSHHAMIRFNESYHNYDLSNNGQDGDGFGIWSEGQFNDPIGEGVILEHNISWANADDGIDMWMNEATVTMRNNIVRNNGYNVLSDPNYVGNGNGFKLGPEGPGGSGKPGHYVIGNIADNNPGDGFDYNGGTVDLYMKGNAATNNGIDYDVPNTSVFEDNTKTGGVPA